MTDILLKRKSLDQTNKIKKKKELKWIIIDVVWIILWILVFIGIVIALSYNI